MRSFATSLIALIISLPVGGFVMQLLSAQDGGKEERAGVFILTVLVAAPITIVFLLVRLAAGTRRVAGVAIVVVQWLIVCLGARAVEPSQLRFGSGQP